MSIKQTLFSVLFLGFINHNALSAEPQVFTMNFDKEAFDSSMPISRSQYSSTEVLFLYKRDAENFLMPIGCLETISLLIKNNKTDSYSILRALKERQSVDCVYYQSCNAIIIDTNRTDLAKKLERLLSSDHYSQVKNQNLANNKNL